MMEEGRCPSFCIGCGKLGNKSLLLLGLQPDQMEFVKKVVNDGSVQMTRGMGHSCGASGKSIYQTNLKSA